MTIKFSYPTSTVESKGNQGSFIKGRNGTGAQEKGRPAELKEVNTGFM